jgi:hypothetical protein
VTDFLTRRDSLHGYIFVEFADRSLADLEDEEQRNSRLMDWPSFFALELNVEFAHARIQTAASDPVRGSQSDPLRVWDAVQFQDVARLRDDDLTELQSAAAMETGWLWKQRMREMQEGRLIAACSVGVAFNDLLDDVRYLNRPAVHVIYDPNSKIPLPQSAK